MTKKAGGEDSRSVLSADTAVRRELAQSHRDLRRFLTRRLGDRSEADEVLQTFALKALERSWSLRNVRSVRGWLGRVLATTLVDHQRRMGARRRRQAAIQAADLEFQTVEPDVELDQAVCNCLHGILPTMKAEYAEVIRRIDILGESRERAAARLGATTNNITVRLHRARHALRRRLEQTCLTCPEHGFFDCRCEDERRRAAIRARVHSGRSDAREPSSPGYRDL